MAARLNGLKNPHKRKNSLLKAKKTLPDKKSLLRLERADFYTDFKSVAQVLWLCVCVYAHVCVRMSVYVCMHMWMCVYMHVCVFYMFVCVLVSLCMHACVCMHVCARARTCLCECMIR